ncbi:MAG: efflux RND transporter permease subunit [Thermoanaerobaculia bacterium]
MNLTLGSLKNPAAVLVAVAVVGVFGVFSLAKLPVQLFPDIERPQISIWTGWRSASPQEVEAEILEPQEEVLQGLPGLKELNTNANAGGSFISLTFGLEADMDQTLIDVISRMNRLPPLPRDATPPAISMGGGFGGGSNQSLSWFFIQLLPGNERTIESYQPLVEDTVARRLETIPGVAGVEVMAWQDKELVIEFDPYRAAELGVQIPAVAALAGSANDVSGGNVDVGRRQYTLRFAGRYKPEQLAGLVLDWRDGRPVTLGDIAEVGVQRAERNGFAVQNNNPAMAIRVDRESGANVLEALNAVKAEVEILRDTVLAENDLTIAQSFDASVFIYRAINLVSSNLFLGVLLATGVLWWFLRQMRATLLVATAIPISVLTTFVVLNVGGRSLNVISLAGLAFAVGMVLDAAIIVLENIVRLRESGRSPHEGSLEGTRQVWGALVASTATTVAIFLPVIYLKDVEGQLFADLALTIAIAVTISLIVAVTILPTAAKKYLTSARLTDVHAGFWDRIAERITLLTDTPRRRLGLIAVLMAIPLTLTLLLMPKLDYLPPVKRDAVDAFFNFPPGSNISTIEEEIINPMVDRMRPYMDGEKEPALKNYYFIVWQGGGTIGARVKEQKRVDELEKIMREEIVSGFPDTRAFVFRGGLFGGFASSREIIMHLQAADVEALMAAGATAMQVIGEAIPGSQTQVFPGTELAEPELRLTPDDRRIAEVGWNRAQVGRVVRSLGDGLWLGEHFDGEKRMNIILRSEKWSDPEELAGVPLATPSGPLVPLGELVDVDRTVGPSSIHRIDRKRTVTLNVSPPDGLSLEEAVATLKAEVEPKLLAIMPEDGAVQYGGSADNLANAIRNMSQNFVIALIVLFLLMSALFSSMKDSLLVVLALPLATVGGVVALRLLNLVTFQPLDLLTMIGFIILLGLVVNNAILLVHQTRQAERDGENRRDAVQQALRVRLRPIFMSTLTSIFGMLPLLLNPGTGSVIYRGLAAVIVGGMCVSTLFTLLLLPSLMRLGEGKAKRPALRAADELRAAS